MNTTPLARLDELGIALPDVATPLAAYVPARQSGSMVFTSGQLPTVGGKLLRTGKVGIDLGAEEAATLARTAALNALAAVHNLVGLNTVTRIIKVVGYVASTPDFVQQPLVINGVSQLLEDIFGDAGRHARAAVGVAALPLNAPVEVELTVEVDS